MYDAATEPTRTSKALVVNPRTLSLLAPAGVAEAMVAEGHVIREVAFHENWRQVAHLDVSDVRGPFGMTVLPQARSEALLARALALRRIEPQRGEAVTALNQDPAGVTLEAGSRDVRAPFAIGADGAHSFVRHALGIDFAGRAFPEDWALFDMELNDPLPTDQAHISFVEGGLLFLIAIRPGLWRVLGNVPDVLDRLPPGTIAGRREWTSSFRISERRAVPVASGRVALVGDAAHIHSPVGGRGMNFGIEDAYVLASCIAAQPGDPVAALARYDALRRPVHRTVVRRLSAITRLARGRPAWIGAARHLVLPVLTGLPPARRQLRDFMTGFTPALETC